MISRGPGMSHVVYGTNSRPSAKVPEKTVLLKSGATGDAAVFERLNAAIKPNKPHKLKGAPCEKCPIHKRAMTKRPGGHFCQTCYQYWRRGADGLELVK